MPPSTTTSTTTTIKQSSSSSTTAQQLLRDLELVRQRRLAVENELHAKDIAVFNLETKYLQMIGTPLPVTTTTASTATSNNNNRETISNIINLSSGIRRGRDGEVINLSTTTTDNGEDENEDEEEKTMNDKKDNDDQEEKRRRKNWVHNHLPTIDDHLSSIRFGDSSADVYYNAQNNTTNLISGTQFIRTVNANERLVSLTNFTATANNAKSGVVDQS